MVKIDTLYTGEKHCELTHGPSGNVIATDAPKDNNGKGEAFSPTDLLASSLSACMLTVMGIEAEKQGIDMKGTRAYSEKHMASDPRRVSKIKVIVQFGPAVPESMKPTLQQIALGCPVKRSLHPDIELPIEFA